MISRIILSFIMFVAVVSCKLDDPQLPVAGFTADSSGCAAPCNVTFTDRSQNISVYAWTYAWRFQDSTNSFASTRTASYRFTKPGDYPVQMVISNPVYGSDTTEQTITIKKK